MRPGEEKLRKEIAAWRGTPGPGGVLQMPALTWTCPRCGQSNPRNMKACGGCGNANPQIRGAV